MRALRTCLLALVAALLLGAPSAQADATVCGITFPTIGNIHRFIGQPVVYDLTNSDPRSVDLTMAWLDGSFDGTTLSAGEQYEFSHAYSSAGTYNVTMYVETSDPTNPLGLCKESFTVGTVRVKGRGPH
jgi:opacity protein-like surface antigen